MDDTTRAILERIVERYDTPRQLPDCDHKSKIYYDCQKLTPNDLARLGAEATGHLQDEVFDIAVGVAYKGIFFSAAIAGGRQIAILRADGKLHGPSVKGRKVLVVVDILCLGHEARRARQILTELGAEVVGAACIIDRSNGALETELGPIYSAHQIALDV